jgi:hypothetical protein
MTTATYSRTEQLALRVVEHLEAAMHAMGSLRGSLEHVTGSPVPVCRQFEAELMQQHEAAKSVRAKALALAAALGEQG